MLSCFLTVRFMNIFPLTLFPNKVYLEFFLILYFYSPRGFGVEACISVVGKLSLELSSLVNSRCLSSQDFSSRRLNQILLVKSGLVLSTRGGLLGLSSFRLVRLRLT